jgi:hypothetical protein
MLLVTVPSRTLEQAIKAFLKVKRTYVSHEYIYGISQIQGYVRLIGMQLQKAEKCNKEKYSGNMNNNKNILQIS